MGLNPVITESGLSKFWRRGLSGTDQWQGPTMGFWYRMPFTLNTEEHVDKELARVSVSFQFRFICIAAYLRAVYM